MKQVYLIILLLSLAQVARAQNMVPNGDFEYYSSCPTSASQIALCTGWLIYSPSSDFFHTCASGTASIPTNWCGSQATASGNGYAGFAVSLAVSGFREAITRPINPLTIGATYEVSMSVSLGDNSMYAVNSLGAYFYDNGSNSVSATTIAATTAQVSYASYGPVIDKTNWVRLVGTFTADSAYDNIAITGFGPAISFVTDTLSGSASYAYYYVDSVVVKMVSHINMTYSDTLLCAGDTIYVPYSVSPTNYFNSNNTFTLQLSNSSGSFTSPVNIGSLTSNSAGTITGVIPTSTVSGAGYRIRIIGSNPGDTSGTNGKNIGIGNPKPVKPVSAGNTPICSGTTLNLTASTTTTGVSWSWTGPNGFTAAVQSPTIANAQTNRAGNYIVTAYIYGCKSKDTTNVTVIQSASPFSAGPDQTLCSGDSIKLTSSTTQSGVSFSWNGPSFTSTLQNPYRTNANTSMSGMYIVTATLNGCVTTDTTNVIVNQTPVKPVAGNNSPVCSGADINLTATTTTPGVSWSWTGPNSFSSSSQNPAVSNAQAANAGNYVVTANNGGCTSKDTTIVSVSATPGSLTAGSNSPLCANDTLKLTSNTSAGVISYAWTGPNSFSSSAQNPTIIHPSSAASGDYYLTVSYSGCTILDTVSVLVKTIPMGLTASGNSPVCTGDTIKLFAGSTTPGVTYLWNGPNAYSVFAQNPAIPGAASIHAGNYYISYLLNGCDVRDTITVVVNPKPAPVTATVNGPICAGGTLNLSSATATSGVTYSWIGPNSFSSSTQNPNITNAQTAALGDYVVTAALGLCNVKDTVTALVKPMPANTAASNNGPVCQGGTLSLAANTTSAGTTFSWAGPNSFSSTAQNPNISNAQPVATGIYTVTFDLNGCSSNANTSAIVTPIPAKPAAGSNTPVCDGTTLNLTASTVAGAAYSWTGPAGFNSLLQNPALSNITPTNAGYYIVRSVSNGCYSNPDTATVTVIPAPNVNIYPNPNDTICQGSNVTFVAVTSNAGSSTSYRWLKNNNPIAGATTATYASTGIADGDVIFCEMTAAGVCPSVYKDSSNKITMTVLPWLAPAVSITSNPSTPLSPYQLVTFTANATNAGTAPGFQWKRNGTDVVGATSFTWGTYQLSDNDDISVVVTSSYMCPQPPTATSNAIKVTVLTGIDDINKSKISVYPNPVHNELVIKGAVLKSVVELYDVLGRVVYDGVIDSDKERINTSALVAGTYVLQLTSSTGERVMYKVVKE